MTDLDHLSAERREKILARAEELIRAERAVRSAPEVKDPEGYTRASWVLVIMIAMFVALMAAVIAHANAETPREAAPRCHAEKVEALVPVGELNMGFIYVAPRWERRLVDRLVCDEWSN